MSRRELLTAGAVASAAVAVGISADAAHDKDMSVRLKVASQERIIPGGSLPERLAKMEKWGIEGIEIGGSGLAKRVPEIQAALANSKVKICAICAGFEGALISDAPAVRRRCVDSMKEILTAAGELGSTGLIFVPAFNGQTKLDFVEGRKVLVDLLPEVAGHAVKYGTRMLLEPLNRGEAWFCRMLADAASICRDANNPGACVMGDFYHMSIEETSDMGAFLSAGDFLHHVHLASLKRKLPGQDERDFTNGFRGLKMLNYRDYCSFECGVLGEPDVEIPKSVKFLQQQWERA